MSVLAGMIGFGEGLAIGALFPDSELEAANLKTALVERSSSCEEHHQSRSELGLSNTSTNSFDP